MSDAAPPPGTRDVTEWLWRARKTRTHAHLGFAGILVGVLGAVAVAFVTVDAGLFMASNIFRGWIATFDFVSNLFILMWAVTLIQLGVNDGTSYQLRFRDRLRKSKIVDVIAFGVFPVLALVWGQFALYPVLAARASDPAYLRRGLAVSDLQHGVVAVMVAYWLVVGTVFALYLIGLRFNPVDLDSYDRIQLRTLRLGKSSKIP